jgi:hypothetical protein
MNRPAKTALVAALGIGTITGVAPAASASTTALQDPPIVRQIFLQDVDPVVCPEFKTVGNATGGDILGLVTIYPDGDVYLGRNYIYDCPPYGPEGGQPASPPLVIFSGLPPR